MTSRPQNERTRWLPPTLAAATLGVMTLLSTAAHAASTTYQASGCHGATHGDEKYLSRYSNTIQYLPSGSQYPDEVHLVCPIVKTTSGPGIVNDSLSVTVAGYSGWATCTLSEYQTTFNGNSNVVSQFEGDGSGYYYTMSLYGNATNYWGNSTTWTYAELHCTLSQLATLTGYTVNEAGSVQANRRIVSAAACKQTPESDSYSYYLGAPHVPYAVPDPGQPGGFVEAPGGSLGFKMSCPLPAGAGAYTQVGLGPALGNYEMGCKAGGSWSYVHRAQGESEWAFKNLVFKTSVALTCAMKNNPDDGDGKVLSYRTSNSASF